jgi:hypothetical protein
MVGVFLICWLTLLVKSAMPSTAERGGMRGEGAHKEDEGEQCSHNRNDCYSQE